MKIVVGDSLGLVKNIDVNNKKVDIKLGETKLNNEVIYIDKIIKVVEKDIPQNNDFVVLCKNEIKVVNIKNEINVFNYNVEKDTNINKFYQNSYNTELMQSCTRKDGLNLLGKYFFSTNRGQISVLNCKLGGKVNDEYKVETLGLNIIKDFLNPHIEKSCFVESIKSLTQTDEMFSLYKEIPLKIWDLNKQVVSFSSKNVSNDELDLKVPIWDVDVVEEIGSNIFYVCTGYGKIRTYDRRAKNKPIADQNEFNKVPFKKLNKIIKVDNYICVGDNAGRCMLMDNRSSIIFI